MSAWQIKPVCQGRLICGYSVERVNASRTGYEMLRNVAGGHMFKTREHAQNAIDKIEKLERYYFDLADIRTNWSGRYSSAGQGKLISLRDAIAKMTGRTPQQVQDEVSTK